MEAEDLPLISVIVPVWNGANVIGRCLAALAAQSYPRERFEVLVVDNGSTDATRAIAESVSFVRVLSEPTPGSYRARNTGLAAARGDYVAFTDADCAPDPDWLANAAAAARAHPDAAVLAGHIALFAEDPKHPACAKYENTFAFDQARHAEFGRCVTANWMSKRETLLAHGGFDASLKSGGDQALSRKLTEAGGRVVYVPDMRVGHPIRGDLGEILTKQRRTVGGRWQTAPRAWRLPSMTVKLSRQYLPRAWRTLRSGDRDVSAVVLAVWAVSLMEIVRLAFGGEPRRA